MELVVRVERLHLLLVLWVVQLRLVRRIGGQIG